MSHAEFTRADWEAEADRWLLTARKHAVHRGALICPPGPVSQSGLVSSEDWPHAGITQAAVEAANLAFGLALCREQVWDQLADSVRERLADWLGHHARLRVWKHNNWLLFPAVIEAFLESVGIPVEGGHGAENVERAAGDSGAERRSLQLVGVPALLVAVVFAAGRVGASGGAVPRAVGGVRRVVRVAVRGRWRAAAFGTFAGLSARCVGRAVDRRAGRGLLTLRGWGFLGLAAPASHALWTASRNRGRGGVQGYVASWHVPRLGASGRELAGARIVTASLVTGRYELRCHLVTAPSGWSLREGAYAVASDGEVSCGSSGSGCSDGTDGTDGAVAWAAGDGVRSLVSGVYVYEAGAVARYENANALGWHSVVPYLSGKPLRSESMHVALHVLDTEPADAAVVLAGVVDVGLFGAEVTARWAEGPTTIVDLGHLFWPWGTDGTS